ncbi:hypothetical protein [Loigolactobacillus backii]|uniref:Uncharacterized protein n=1 Tax=Loigolactobacillus backii TaxID=375175 RepID=A0A192GZG8_9LACO|nr:hypothetical protein [Loigolactobacillus backii]ANK60503.1 hypothetical protein AYR52_09700 [Loigolactobacillus backii]ANK61929.1 hypothetical protein AYR53_03590 [Loigolactobacillus backii]ANK65454.1 hypothetical protein AYR54_09525 [Loigolactobacillus backii]ANK68877.1 hypothetical protein AYR56_01135 [Loigolactobacillus backii]MDA5386876.1 hypothetical protein [Loigolactobacillus backii]
MAKIKGNIISILAFLIGLFACCDSIYFLLVGITPILWVYVFSFLLLFYLCISDRKRLISGFKRVSGWYWLFLASCFLSIIPTAITFVYKPVVFKSFFTGQFMLILATFVYLAVLCLLDRLSIVYKGVWFGIIANVIMAVLQYIGFTTGRFITLYNLFPQKDYYVSLPWNAQLREITDINFLTTYRASGLYLETSYYAVFLIAALLVALYFQKMGFFHWLILLLLFSFLIISSSANTALLIILFIAFLIIQRKYIIQSLTYSSLSLLIIGGTAIFGLLFINFASIIDFFQSNHVMTSLIESVRTMNLQDQGNQERYQNMMTVLGLYQKNWFGVGFNMLPSYIEQTIGSQLRYNTAFNWFINLLLEVGPLGVSLYCLMVFSWIRKNLLAGRLGLLISISLIGVTAVQFANGVKLFPIFLILFGAATLNAETAKSTQKKLKSTSDKGEYLLPQTLGY